MDTLWRLVTDLLIVRELGLLQLEEMLYAQLVFIYRSPDTLMRLTRRLRHEGEQQRRNTLDNEEQLLPPTPPLPPTSPFVAPTRSSFTSPPHNSTAQSGTQQTPLSQTIPSTSQLHSGIHSSSQPAVGSSVQSPTTPTESSLRQRSKPKA